jgi:hypothetical protein
VTKAVNSPDVAKAIVQVQLGGIELGYRHKKNGQDEWVCPADYSHPGVLMQHLLIWHSVFGSAVSGQNLTALTSLHSAMHTEEHKIKTGFAPHVHNPEFGK